MHASPSINSKIQRNGNRPKDIKQVETDNEIGRRTRCCRESTYWYSPGMRRHSSRHFHAVQQFQIPLFASIIYKRPNTDQHNFPDCFWVTQMNRLLETSSQCSKEDALLIRLQRNCFRFRLWSALLLQCFWIMIIHTERSCPARCGWQIIFSVQFGLLCRRTGCTSSQWTLLFTLMNGFGVMYLHFVFLRSRWLVCPSVSWLVAPAKRTIQTY